MRFSIRFIARASNIPRHAAWFSFVAAVLIFACGCHPTTPAVSASTAADQVPVYTAEVVHTYPHDTNAFTEGLVFLNGQLLESTGLNGRSNLRRVDLETGKVLQQLDLPAQYFGEGISVFGHQIFQLTWQNHQGFVYDLDSFKQVKDFTYDCEGWGFTTDGHFLIMSDGTDQLRFMDPATLEVKRIIQVKSHGQPVTRINELEYINGEIFANLWTTDYLIRINPDSGVVTGMIDLTGLLPAEDRTPATDVLNGIAYDPDGKRIFVTGKLWPKLFEIRLQPK